MSFQWEKSVSSHSDYKFGWGLTAKYCTVLGVKLGPPHFVIGFMILVMLNNRISNDHQRNLWWILWYGQRINTNLKLEIGFVVANWCFWFQIRPTTFWKHYFCLFLLRSFLLSDQKHQFAITNFNFEFQTGLFYFQMMVSIRFFHKIRTISKDSIL